MLPDTPVRPDRKRVPMTVDDLTAAITDMYRSLGDRAAFDRAVRRWGIGWTILPPASRLAERLDRDPGWRRIYADRWAVVHVAVAPRAASDRVPARPAR